MGLSNNKWDKNWTKNGIDSNEEDKTDRLKEKYWNEKVNIKIAVITRENHKIKLKTLKNDKLQCKSCFY